MRHLILALLAATFSLSVTAATNLNSSKSNVVEEAVTVKGSKSNSDNREQSLSGADSCSFTIDEAGVKRTATPQQKEKCEKESKGKMPAYGRSETKIKDAVVK